VNKTSLAAYYFASPKTAKYLAQFIPAHLTCVNHIPASLLGKSDLNSLPPFFTHSKRTIR